MASPSFAAYGDVLATLNFASYQMVADPSQPYVYASVANTDSIAVINTQTYQVDHTISLAGVPRGIALSPDGSTLYATQYNTNSIAVIDTHSFTVSRNIFIAATPSDIAVGRNNILYVLGQTSGAPWAIQEINATTGNALPVTFPKTAQQTYFGVVRISPDQNTLYYMEEGLSSSWMFSYNVVPTSPTLLASANGGQYVNDAVLSHNGNAIASVSDNLNVSVYNTGFGGKSYATAGNASAVAFSPDDQSVYVNSYSLSPTLQRIDLFTNTVGPAINVPDRSNTMITDSTGKDLFVSYEGINQPNLETIIYDTTPEPTSLSLLVLSIPLLVTCRRNDVAPRRTV